MMAAGDSTIMTIVTRIIGRDLIPRWRLATGSEI
jgi:hypothetical protein